MSKLTTKYLEDRGYNKYDGDPPSIKGSDRMQIFTRELEGDKDKEMKVELFRTEGTFQADLFGTTLIIKTTNNLIMLENMVKQHEKLVERIGA